MCTHSIISRIITWFYVYIIILYHLWIITLFLGTHNIIFGIITWFYVYTKIVSEIITWFYVYSSHRLWNQQLISNKRGEVKRLCFMVEAFEKYEQSEHAKRSRKRGSPERSSFILRRQIPVLLRKRSINMRKCMIQLLTRFPRFVKIFLMAITHLWKEIKVSGLRDYS